MNMLNISFLACTSVELWDLTVCIAVNGEKFQSRNMTLTLVPQRPISVELVRDIFINYNVFQFHVNCQINYFLSYRAKTRKHTHTTDSGEYSKVAFCKHATIINWNTHDRLWIHCSVVLLM